MKKPLSETTIATLDAVAAILLRCFIITVGAMLFTWVVWLTVGGTAHSVYGQMMEITRKELDLFFLSTMAFMKGLNLIFFLFPFLAIKWYLMGKR